MKSRTVEISLEKGCISLNLEEGERGPFKQSNGRVNVSNGVILKNLRHNMKRTLPQLRLTPEREEELVILAGGASMLDYVDEIKERIDGGAKCMVMNGTHDWAASQGILRHFYSMIEMRPSGAQFVANPHPGIVYCISSACSPLVFDALKDIPSVYMMHCAGMQSRTTTLNRYYYNRIPAWVEGGSTIGLRAPMLAWWLGFRKFHFYGLDSCIIDTRHHAYPQALNDDSALEIIKVGDREFFCQGWMGDQAIGFLNFIRDRGDLFQLQVHGDGLIAYLMEYIPQRGMDQAA